MPKVILGKEYATIRELAIRSQHPVFVMAVQVLNDNPFTITEDEMYVILVNEMLRLIDHQQGVLMEYMNGQPPVYVLNVPDEEKEAYLEFLATRGIELKHARIVNEPKESETGTEPEIPEEFSPRI